MGCTILENTFPHSIKIEETMVNVIVYNLAEHDFLAYQVPNLSVKDGDQQVHTSKSVNPLS